jgi:hypothetical protein
MQDSEAPGQQAYLSRSELELHLARLALVVMRAAPDVFADLGGPAPKADPLDASPGDVAADLLRRASPEHRPFVEARLMELARCLAGTRAAWVTHDWLDVTLAAPSAGAAPTPPHRGSDTRRPA